MGWLVSVALLALMAGPGWAQTAEQYEDLARQSRLLRLQIEELQRFVFRGIEPGKENQWLAERDQQRALLGRFQTQQEVLSQELRELTGRIETMEFHLQQREQETQAFFNDLQFRLERLDAQLQQLSALAPVTAESETDEEAEAALAAPESEDPAKRDYDRALQTLQERNPEQAAALFREFLAQYPSHELSANAYYWLGESHYVRNEYALAARNFSEAYKVNENGNKTPDSLLKLGLSLLQLGQNEAGCGSFLELVQRFPQADAPILERADEEIAKNSCL